MRRLTRLAAWAFGLVGVCALAVSCSGGGKPSAVARSQWPAPMSVVVSIPPLKGLIEPLLPPGSTVTVLIPPGVSEHGYEVPPGQLKGAINADMLVWIGGMEPQVDALSAANKREKRVDVRLVEVLNIRPVEHDGHDHDHDHAEGGGQDGHGHGGDDPHVWLDPTQAVLITRRLADRIVQCRPLDSVAAGAHPAEVACKGAIARLNDLDAEFRGGLAGAGSRTIVVGHDAYGWLARRYDLQTVAISGLNATEPTPGDLQKAKEAVRANKLRAVFAEPQLNPAAAKRIADETGAEVLALDPLGDGDYFKMMRSNLAVIRTALGLQGGTASPAPR